MLEVVAAIIRKADKSQNELEFHLIGGLKFTENI